MTSHSLGPVGSSSSAPQTQGQPVPRRLTKLQERVEQLYGEGSSTSLLTGSVQRRISSNQLPEVSSQNEAPSKQEKKGKRVHFFVDDRIYSPVKHEQKPASSSTHRTGTLRPENPVLVVVNSSDDEDSVGGIMPEAFEESTSYLPTSSSSLQPSSMRFPPIKRVPMHRMETLNLLGDDLKPQSKPTGFNRRRKMKRNLELQRQKIVESYSTSADHPNRCSKRMENAQVTFERHGNSEGVKLANFLRENQCSVREPALRYRDQITFDEELLNVCELLELDLMFENLLEFSSEALDSEDSPVDIFMQHHQHLLAINTLIDLENAYLSAMKTEINPELPSGRTLFRALEKAKVLTKKERGSLERRLDEMVKASERLVKGLQNIIGKENPNFTDTYLRFFNNHNPQNIYEKCRSIRRWTNKTATLEAAMDRMSDSLKRQYSEVVNSNLSSPNSILSRESEILAQMRAGLMKLKDQNLVDAMNRRIECYRDMLRWNEISEHAARTKID